MCLLVRGRNVPFPPKKLCPTSMAYYLSVRGQINGGNKDSTSQRRPCRSDTLMFRFGTTCTLYIYICQSSILRTVAIINRAARTWTSFPFATFVIAQFVWNWTGLHSLRLSYRAS